MRMLVKYALLLTYWTASLALLFFSLQSCLSVTNLYIGKEIMTHTSAESALLKLTAWVSAPHTPAGRSYPSVLERRPLDALQILQVEPW